jgi:DNA polymerase-3 subunit delta'
MSGAELPEPDREGDAPHPRHSAALYGQQAAEAAFLDAYREGKLHHAWLITGPRGVGKATLAWRIARFLLTAPEPADAGLFGAPEPPATLESDPEHPVARRIAALTEGRLFLLRRGSTDKGDRLSADLRVGEVRKLQNFFAMSATEGGRRVVIVDTVDEMTDQAANALLKMLEEPPRDAVLLLISHQPARLLPTIRSRCRVLRCAPLGPGDLTRALAPLGLGESASGNADGLAILAGGSVGAALRIAELDGLQSYAALIGLFDGAPGIDRPAALRLADSVAGPGNDARFGLLVTLVDIFLSRLARTGVSGPPDMEIAPGEAMLLARLAPDARAARHWAGLQQQLGARARAGRAVNLDPAALVLDMLLAIDTAAAPQGAR